MDVVGITTWERRLGGLPAELITFYNDGGGNLECFQVPAEAGNEAVFCYLHENRQVYRDADSFSAFLWSRLAQR